MMVPTTRLSHFFAGMNGDIKTLVTEVTSEICRKPPTGQVRSAVIAFMQSVLRRPSHYHLSLALPDVAESAVVLSLPALYLAAVSEAAKTLTRLGTGLEPSGQDWLLRNSEKMVLKITLLALQEKKKNGGAPIEWSDWYGA